MSLDLPALARTGANLIWDLVPSVLTACTLRDSPVAGAYNVDTDTAPLTWGHSVSLTAFLYADKESERLADLASKASETSADMAVKARKAIVRVSDAAGMPVMSTKAELLETVSGDLWHVVSTETPPGQAIHILTIRR